MRTHVGLELFRIGALRRFPPGDLLNSVEVVREVFGVGVAHFPVGRETSIRLECAEHTKNETLVEH